MGNPTRRPPLPPITVHQEAAAQAQHRLAGLLEAAGAAPAETQRLIAVTGAGAVEAAHAEVLEQEADVRPGRSDPFDAGRRGAVEALTGRLAHIADHTVRQVQAVAEPSPVHLSPPSRCPRRSMTMVDNVGEEQVLRVLERAERIFVSLTGHTHFGRDLSEEILPLVLKLVSAENDHRSDQRCLVDVPMGWVPHQSAGLLVPG